MSETSGIFPEEPELELGLQTVHAVADPLTPLRVLQSNDLRSHYRVSARALTD